MSPFYQVPDVAFGIDGPNFNTGSYFAPASDSFEINIKSQIKTPSRNVIK
jgi:hypothetical protein